MNSQQRRAGRRNVVSAMKEAGCTCQAPWPMLHADAAAPPSIPGIEPVEHGEAVHDYGCVLGEKIIRLHEDGLQWLTVVQAPASCSRGRS